MAIQNNFPAIKPALLLDFANTKQLDPRITFTRASTATFYGTQTAKAEENLLIRSQEFSTTAAWSATSNNTTVTANTSAAPDGTTTASTITDTTASSTYFAVQSVTGVSIPNAATTASVFLKSNTSQFAYLSLWDGTTYATAVVDLTGGTVTSTSGSPSATSITSVGNGWYRVSVTKTINTSTFVLVGLSNSGTPTFNAGRPFYSGTASLSVFAWGAQLEQRSAVTAYTATTTQPITNYIPVLQTAASGVARFEHNPITFESLGLEIEEQRTNLLVRSEDFGTTWTNQESTEEVNAVIAPDGTLTADKLIPTTANDSHWIGQNITATAAAHTFSFYAKAAGYSIVQVLNSSDATDRINFDLTNGTVGSATTYTGTITAVGNGWYRCTATYTTSATTAAWARIAIVPLSTSARGAAFAGNGFSGVFLWGAQFELGAFPTSYIQTVASQVTRAADSASMTGTNFSSWYNAAEGSVYFDGATYSTSSPTMYSISNGTATGELLQLNQTSGGAVRLEVRNAGTSQAAITTSVTATANIAFKNASAYKVNDFAATTNAGTVGTDTSGTVPVPDRLFFLQSGSGATTFSGVIRKLAYYPLRVTNANLQALTS